MRTRLFRRCLVHANKDGESSEHEAAALLPKFACVYLCIGMSRNCYIFAVSVSCAQYFQVGRIWGAEC